MGFGRWYQVGRRLCSISAYELQLIDDKIRDAGIIEYAGQSRARWARRGGGV